MHNPLRRISVVLAATTLILVAAPLPTPAATGEAGRLLTLINSSRAGAGLGPVRLDSSLSSIASSHARRMAAEGRVFHSPSFPGNAGEWQAWGENVGTAPNADAVHKAFMESSIHRANILSPRLNLVGIGVASWSRGVMYVEDFLGRSGGSAPAQAVSDRASSARRTAPAKAVPPPPPPPPPAAKEPMEPLGCHWVISAQ